jgi:hypothetical protein
LRQVTGFKKYSKARQTAPRGFRLVAAEST